MVFKTAKRVVIFVIGMTVILVGVVASVVPGLPAIVIVPVGLAILATEFAWARVFLRKIKRKLQGLAPSSSNRPASPPPDQEASD